MIVNSILKEINLKKEVSQKWMIWYPLHLLQHSHLSIQPGSFNSLRMCTRAIQQTKHKWCVYQLLSFIYDSLSRESSLLLQVLYFLSHFICIRSITHICVFHFLTCVHPMVDRIHYSGRLQHDLHLRWTAYWNSTNEIIKFSERGRGLSQPW